MAEADCTVPVKVNHTHHLEVGENAFWLLIWTIAGVTVSVVIGMALYYNHKTDELIARQPDPVEVRCALATSTHSQQCMALMAKRQN